MINDAETAQSLAQELIMTEARCREIKKRIAELESHTLSDIESENERVGTL